MGIFYKLVIEDHTQDQSISGVIKLGPCG